MALDHSFPWLTIYFMTLYTNDGCVPGVVEW